MKYLANEIIFIYDKNVTEIAPCIFNKDTTKVKTIKEGAPFDIELIDGFRLKLCKDGKQKVVNYITMYTAMKKLQANVYIPRDANNKLWRLITKFNYDLSKRVVPDYLLENPEFCNLFLVDNKDVEELIPSVKELLREENKKYNDYLEAKKTIKSVQDKGRDF